MNTLRTANGTEYLWQPLSKQETISMLGEEGRVHANCSFSLDELIENDMEGLNDLASEKLIGSYHLQEIGYNVVDVDEGSIVIIEIDGWVDEEDYINL